MEGRRTTYYEIEIDTDIFSEDFEIKGYYFNQEIIKVISTILEKLLNCEVIENYEIHVKKFVKVIKEK